LLGSPEENRPENVFVAILKDGHENASRNYTLSKVREMINHQKETYSWEFIFPGVNQDAFAEAAKMGIDREDSFNFKVSKEGIKQSYNDMHETVSKYRKR